MSEIDDLLGIDETDDVDALAGELVRADFSWIEQLVAHRKRLGLTQDQVARAMGRSQSVVSDLETMSSDPRLSSLRRYAQAVRAAVRHRVFSRAGPHPLVRLQSGPVTVRTVSAGTGRPVHTGSVYLSASGPAASREP